MNYVQFSNEGVLNYLHLVQYPINMTCALVKNTAENEKTKPQKKI